MKQVLLSGKALISAAQFRLVSRAAKCLSFVTVRRTLHVETGLALPVLREWMPRDVTIDEAALRVEAGVALAKSMPSPAPMVADSVEVGAEWMLVESETCGHYHPANSLMAILATGDGIVFEFVASAYLLEFTGKAVEAETMAMRLISPCAPVPHHITSRPASDYIMPVSNPRLHVSSITPVSPGAASTMSGFRILRDFRAEPSRKAYAESSPPAPTTKTISAKRPPLGR